jgi:uncharacterized membrane protein YdbT with pleckstrin-like domain
LCLARWGISQLGALVGFAVFLNFWPEFSQKLPRPVRHLVTFAEVIAVGIYLLQAAFTLAMAFLNYQLRWYIVTDRSLRIRYGIAQVREMTMTFANIQHISIRQGPLQRALGIADLQVRTAGGGSGGEGPGEQNAGAHAMHVGYFEGVSNAEEIRDLILERLRHYRDAGLGDTEKVHPPAAEVPATETLIAAGELLEEARAFTHSLKRRVVSGSSNQE